MKYKPGMRLFALALAVCLLLGMVPMYTAVEADALGLSSLTCSNYISNPTSRSYIDTMMRYYINNNSNLQNTLNGGKCVVFMFEGGSDNYWNGETYEKSLYDNRIQAVVFVVKLDASGNAYIDYCSETCSSIASNVLNATPGVGYSGSTTILDGVYRMYRWNHTGPYASFQLDVNNSNANGYGLYTPSSVPDGQLLGCSGINVHTRSTTSGSNWSAGCQVIGTGATTSNEYNQFFRSVTGFNFDPWVNYYSSPKTLYSYDYYGYGYGSSYTVGYYVVDRQLAMIGTDGVKYGSGSLVNVFNQTALSKLTSYSTPKAEAAGALNFEYSTSQCTFYPSHCQIKGKLEGAPVNSQPCSVSTTYKSETLETVTAGKTYTATGLFKNHYGNYWYRVTTSAGKTGYIYAGETEYVDDITSDVTLTGASAPNGHVAGKVFVVNGTIKAAYNELTAMNCYVYKGIGASGSPVTGTSAAAPDPNSYTLASSTLDNGTAMNELAQGNYTYRIQAAFRNYYATSATTLASNTGTLTLMEEYFVVIPAAKDQSTCSHTNTTHVVKASTCTTNGTSVTTCSTCGKVTKSTVTASHSYGAWTTTKKATCTEAGTQSRSCAKCGNVETKTVAASGHSYTMTSHPATCKDYERFEYICGNCGHSYNVYDDELMSEWQETKPEGVDESLIETKTQYRYSDYETKTSYETSLAGYTKKSEAWVQSGTSTIHYVKSWPSGFDTSNSIYASYNGQKFASETATQKVTVKENGVVGYVYYHWCRGSYTEGPINRTTSATKDGTHVAFHAFVAPLSSIDPSTLPTASDGSVTYANGNCCKDSHWYYPIPIYDQSVTTYKKQFTYERWTDYSEWSDTAVTASSTRKVETRTVYRYVDAKLGDHVWSNGFCAVCGRACEHSWQNAVCTTCGKACAHSWADGTCSTCGKACVHTWADGTCTTCGRVCDHSGGGSTCPTCGQTLLNPSITAKYPTIALEEEVQYNIYYTFTDLGDVALEDMGLITWSSAQSEGTIDTAEAVIPGAIYDGTYYMVRSQGIPAKKLGDSLYFKIYARLADGTYVYSQMYRYSAATYIKSNLTNSSSPELKRVCVALLNYGASAQEYFSYKHYSLMNAGLTEEQKAMVNAYSSDMVADVVKADSSKTTLFAYTSAGFTQRYPSVSLEGAFEINYYFKTAYAPVGSVTFYYWDAQTYDSVSLLTPENAVGSKVMTLDESGRYTAAYDGIAAKELDETVYVAAVYEANGTRYCTGVLAYSVAASGVSQIKTGTDAQKKLAENLLVYGYYAKEYFKTV